MTTPVARIREHELHVQLLEVSKHLHVHEHVYPGSQLFDALQLLPEGPSHSH